MSALDDMLNAHAMSVQMNRVNEQVSDLKSRYSQQVSNLKSEVQSASVERQYLLELIEKLNKDRDRLVRSLAGHVAVNSALTASVKTSCPELTSEIDRSMSFLGETVGFTYKPSSTTFTELSKIGEKHYESSSLYYTQNQKATRERYLRSYKLACEWTNLTVEKKRIYEVETTLDEYQKLVSHLFENFKNMSNDELDALGEKLKSEIDKEDVSRDSVCREFSVGSFLP